MPRMQRNIYKRKDGRYEARYIKGYGENGKAKYASVYGKTYAETKEKYNRLKPEEKKQQTDVIKTVAGESQAYLNELQNQIKASTYGIYQGYIRKYIAPYFGSAHCVHLTNETLQGFIDTQIKNGLSAATVQSVFSFFKAALKTSVPPPAFKIKLPKLSPQKAAAFSVCEQKRLEEAAKKSDAINNVSVILCLYTGIRIGELCGLMWDDIDFAARKMHVRRTIQRIKDYGEDSGKKTKVIGMYPKSVSSNRIIPLPDFLVELLKTHKEGQGKEYVISRNGKPVEPRNIQYRFGKLLSKANMKRVNFHTTRHTFSARALESGFDIKTLSEILGHSSPAVTLNQYAHSLDENKRRRMESLSVIYQQ